MNMVCICQFGQWIKLQYIVSPPPDKAWWNSAALISITWFILQRYGSITGPCGGGCVVMNTACAHCFHMIIWPLRCFMAAASVPASVLIQLRCNSDAEMCLLASTDRPEHRAAVSGHSLPCLRTSMSLIPAFLEMGSMLLERAKVTATSSIFQLVVVITVC